MRARLFAIVTASVLVAVSPAVAPAAAAQRPAPECDEWRVCQEMALEARALGQYERFHDLAWRTVQTGPRNDPALMYLLARAQSLSNRPRDALIMLGRLAERGIVTDAATEPDFDAARRLPGWRDLEVLMNRAAVAAASAAAAPAPPVTRAPPAAPAPAVPAASLPTRVVAPPPSVKPIAEPIAAPPAVPTPVVPAVPARPSAVAPAAASTALRYEVRLAEEVSRMPAAAYDPSGLVYDAVSRRLLLGDATGRRVVIVRESDPLDLVRQTSAGFHDVTALEIDTKRGDLWVASTTPDRASGAIHRLQLVSGRPLATIEVPQALGPVGLVDLTIASDGGVLVLDAVGSRVLRLGARAGTPDVLVRLDAPAPDSLTVTGDGRTVFVTHREGIARLDLQSRRVTPVTATAGIALGGFERVRWHRGALVGVQVSPDGLRRIVRLQLNGRLAVTAATVLEPPLGRDGGPTRATITGDEMYLLETQPGGPTMPESTRFLVVRRVHLP